MHTTIIQTTSKYTHTFSLSFSNAPIRTPVYYSRTVLLPPPTWPGQTDALFRAQEKHPPFLALSGPGHCATGTARPSAASTAIPAAAQTHIVLKRSLCLALQNKQVSGHQVLVTAHRDKNQRVTDTKHQPHSPHRRCVLDQPLGVNFVV